MVKVRTCQCCGHPLPEYEVMLGFTRKQQQLFVIVQKAGQAGIAAEQIIDRLYAGDQNGGPESANILSVMHQKMKPNLFKNGMKFATQRGTGALWRLEKI